MLPIGLTLIWHVTVWKIWEARNGSIFHQRIRRWLKSQRILNIPLGDGFLQGEREGRVCFELFSNPLLCMNQQVWLFSGGQSTPCTLQGLWVQYLLHFSHFVSNKICCSKTKQINQHQPNKILLYLQSQQELGFNHHLQMDREALMVNHMFSRTNFQAQTISIK